MFRSQRPLVLVLACFAVAALSGCCLDQARRPAGPPPEQRVIPLAEAIKQVQEAVHEARQAAEDHKIGVVPSKVTFNLKLAATDTHAVGKNIDLGVAIGPVTAGYGSTDTFTTGDSAESSITLELVNPLLADKDTIIGTIMAAAEEPAPTPSGGGAKPHPKPKVELDPDFLKKQVILLHRSMKTDLVPSN